MADQRLEALILQLNGMEDLLNGQPGRTQFEKDINSARINETIRNLREEEKQAIAEKKEAAFYGAVADLAKNFGAMTAASIDLAHAVKGGDPFAISASSLSLAASLVSTISLAGGPVGAAVGAVVGAVLSIISMILKLFQEESDSLLSQIEQLLREIDAQHRIIQLGAAKDEIRAFLGQALTKTLRNIERAQARAAIAAEVHQRAISSANVFEAAVYQAYEPQIETIGLPTRYTYSQILLEFQIQMNALFEPKNWLETGDNPQLPLWGEVLHTLLQVYASFKVAVAAWLPLVEPDSQDQIDLLDWRDKYDPIMLEFLKRVKPLARNRGILCHVGKAKDVFVRDMVISPKRAKWTRIPDTSAHAIAGAYRSGLETSPHPFLSILHLGGTETFDVADRSKLNEWDMDSVWSLEENFRKHPDYEERDRRELLNAKRHPFSKKSRVYDLDGSWPLQKLKWDQLSSIGEVYDICAIPGNAQGEIDIYAATGDAIASYTDVGGDQHIRFNTNHTVPPGFKAKAVRAVRPKTLTGEDPTVLENKKRILYALCEDSNHPGDPPNYPFKIWAYFWPGPIVDGAIAPPLLFHARNDSKDDWRNYLVGIAVDAVRLWIFSKCFIACVSHTNVKQHLEKKEKMPDWTIYSIPPEVMGYHPSAQVSMGLSDLSACDDGTLTAVFEEKRENWRYDDERGFGRIFTATPEFRAGALVIEREEVNPATGEIKKTHGWVREPHDQTVAFRVHKLPIFCWPAIEGLETRLSAKKP